MAPKILVAYVTRYGSTQEVAEAIAEMLGQSGLAVDLCKAKEVRSVTEYQAVVLGAALYMYRWHKDARRFLSRHRKDLIDLPVAVFALGPVKDPRDESEWMGARAQLYKELANYLWFQPAAIEIFGGKFDPEALGFPMNLFARSEPATDIRDWPAIRAWATGLIETLEAAVTAQSGP